MTAIVDTRAQNLFLANEVRYGIADLKASIRELTSKEGARFAAEVIDRDYGDRVIGAIPMEDLLTSVRAIGHGKAVACLRAAKLVNPRIKLRDLSPSTRDAVAAQLRWWASVYPIGPGQKFQDRP